jgi:hypothetical protein
VTGPGDGWEPWDGDGAEPAAEEPWAWPGSGPGLDAELPVELSEPPDPADPADPVDLPDPPEPRNLPAEAAADWSAAGDPAGGPAGWTDPAGAGLGESDSDPFPPALAVDVAPADGGPWVDPDLLGDGDPDLLDAGAPPHDPPAALRDDLAAADGDPGADWSALRASDDPAIRALAALWQPDAG